MIVKAKDKYYVINDCHEGRVEQERASGLHHILLRDRKADIKFEIGSFRNQEDAERILHKIMTAWSQDTKMIDVTDEPGWN